MSDDFQRRLEAVERAVSDGHTDLTAVSDAAASTERLARLEARVDDLEAELATVDGRLQAIRGYLGGVNDVSADVERRADLALAKASKIETMMADECDDLVVERLPETQQRPVSHHTETSGPDDSGADSDSGWAAQAIARLSSPTESDSLFGGGTTADATEGDSSTPNGWPRPESGADAESEDSDSDRGTDGSFVGHLRGAFDQ